MNFEHPHLLWLLLVPPPGWCCGSGWPIARGRNSSNHSSRRDCFRRLPFRDPSDAPGNPVCPDDPGPWPGPSTGFDLQEVEQHGLDLVVAVDTSKSMLATDIPPHRLSPSWPHWN